MMSHRYTLRITVLSIATISALLTGCSITSVAQGVNNNQLAKCSTTPNCISSQDTSKLFHYPEIPFEGTPTEAKEKLLLALKEYPRCEISQNDGRYIHAKFITAVFRFRDDAEFLIKENAIEVRSASRLGYSDFGKNRSRMNEIKEAFLAK